MADVRPALPPRALAAADFAMGIRSRRDVLQTLFYDTKNSAAEAWEFHRQLESLEVRYDGGGVAVQAGNIMPRHELLNAKSAAEATAQDAASAFVLILDYAIRRLRRAIKPIDTRTLGPQVRNGVRLNAAIWALANQARHADAWLAVPAANIDNDPDARNSVRVFRTLALDPHDLNAAREFVCGLNVNSYVAVEAMLLATAHEVLAGTSWRLGMVSAGTYFLEPDR